ncbi:MAG: hypothetical protein K1X72_02615 [Pyrinomonadaceae bacterium]|nr:hypothetical protein [Pyrinomonadaceae bacterium]
MKIAFITFFIILVFSIETKAQTQVTPITQRPFPEGFKSDGCTHFPDGIYGDCCVEHDLDYFNGGSWMARWRSDRRLYQCVKSKGGFKHSVLAIMMWTAVRGLGSPIFHTKFRWGFGKDLIKENQNQSAKSQNLKK